MCGIAGFTGGAQPEVLRRMTDAIQHRGPDAEGHWHEEAAGISLGHRRLSIVDLTGGTQPMWTSDGEIGVTFNGEIYNHRELRAELKAAGCQFLTDHSDTEVLLHAYRTWGDRFVDRMNGMWAFVIYDRGRRRLFGSRDRFGKKPLYYFHEGHVFGFASELSALLQHPAAPRSLSVRSLKKYFAYCYVPAPRSLYERVWKLPGGHSFSFDLSGAELRTWQWWDFVLEPDPELAAHLPASPGHSAPQNLREAQLCEQIRAVLETAVQRRLMADVPLGVFLSGGLDSSAVATLAAKHVGGERLNTFAIGFNDPTFDETSYAALVARALGTNHHHETLDLDRSIEMLPEIVERLDEPLGDSSLLPTYQLCKFARQHVTVALGGDGADELFAGYDPFRALRMAELYSKWVPRPLHIAARLMAARLPVSDRNISADFKIKRTLSGLSYPPKFWNPVWMGAVEPCEMAQLFLEPCDPEEIYSEAITAWDQCRQTDVVERSLQFWTKLYLQDGILAKVDRASMLCSLEARSPFLDNDFVNLARRIPWQLKLRRGETKWILKQALAPVLPRQIIERPKKGFGMPIGRWLRKRRFEFHLDRLQPTFCRAFVEAKLAAHRERKSDERLFLWCYWLLDKWLNRPAV